MSQRDALSYLESLDRFGIVFGLENISRLLRVLGDPQRDLKAIHVGGTNGKGSVCAMVAAVLQEGGYRVGLYTSPHLVSLTERIQINGVPISWTEMTDLTTFVRTKAEEYDVPHCFTFFDFITALAIYYFYLRHVGVSILEVGLGGRMDSTNIINPVTTVITNVERDHVQILGDRIEDIAREKAGIIKPGVPLISGSNRAEVIHILEAICNEKGSSFRLIGRDFCGERTAAHTMAFRGRRWRLEDIRLGLVGAYQVLNAAVALETLETLEERGYNIDEGSVYRGLAKVRWPGRLEIVQMAPQIVLDGAHNPAGARSLKTSLQEEFDYQRLYMVIGVMQDKEVSGILAELAPLADVLIATSPRNPRSMPAKGVALLAKNYCKEVKVIEEVVEGVDYARHMAAEDDLIVVTGSLFTVGAVRDYLLDRGGA